MEEKKKFSWGKIGVIGLIDIQKIMGYGVMRTPAIVINEKVKAFGRIPGKDEIKKFIKDEA